MFDVWIMFKLLFGLTPSRIFGRIVDFLIDRIVLFDQICSVLKRALFIGVTSCSAGFVLKTIVESDLHPVFKFSLLLLTIQTLGTYSLFCDALICDASLH